MESSPSTTHPSTTHSARGASASRAQALPTRRKELVILITAGWALFTVFVLTVLGGLLPLQLRNLAWSQNLSRLIVDAGSLALVGLCLVRYGSYLRTLDLPRRSSRSGVSTSAAARSSTPTSSQSSVSSNPSSNPSSKSSSNSASKIHSHRSSRSSRRSSRSGLSLATLSKGLYRKLIVQPLAALSAVVFRNQGSQNSSGSNRFPLDQSARDTQAIERNKLWVRRMAIAGTIGMLLLAPLQVVIFLRGASDLDLQFTQATLQQRQQFEQLEGALRDAPAERLRQGWLQLKRLDPATAPATLPAPSAQLDDLIAEANRNRDTSLQDLRRQASGARFALGRDSLRVLLASLLYGWAFWAFFRRA